MREVLGVVHERGADMCAVGSAATERANALDFDLLSIPVAETAEEIAPILEVLPVQRLALGLALERGSDPDHPRGLSKVTKTR
jgi:glucosamine--fructose-6-phosphate aminotransferase (isomerizing)